MSSGKIRSIVFYKDFFQQFFDRQNDKVKSKIVWTLELIEELPNIPETYLKHISGTENLYEIRVQVANDIFRIFCFFDKGRIVVILNAYQKKEQKTSKREILKALHIKKEYDNEKK